MKEPTRIAILGAGNIGTAIADGLIVSGRFPASGIVLTRRRASRLDAMKARGCVVLADNLAAIDGADVVLVAVEPRQIDSLLAEIAPGLAAGGALLVSVVTGVTIRQITDRIGTHVTVVRAMPNTAIAVRESMTCLASNEGDGEAIRTARSIFDTVGRTRLVREEQMIAATALGACGIAFFLRAVRAASQGGIEIGLHAETALEMAAQTARGAASLLLAMGSHPEQEIDRVTTPMGCTIAGLNRMEHEGFSSAMIQGITASAEKAARLYSGEGE